MSDSDALLWTIEKDPLLRSTITTVAVLDRAPDRRRFEAAVERCSRAVPRLRERVVGNPFSLAPPRWEVDPHFDLGYHVRWVRAAGDGSMRDVLDLAEPIAMQGFDRARPLWEMTVVDGLAGGGAAAIMKLHHAITDGVGGIAIAMHLFDLEREGTPRDEAPDAPVGRRLGPVELFVDSLLHAQRRQLGIARRSARVLADGAGAVLRDAPGAAARLAATAGSVGRMVAPATTPLSDVMTGRSLSVRFDVLRLPIDDLKLAAKRAGGRLNDAFVAGVAGGLHRYHRHHGSSVDALRMTMPINLRDESTADLAGNQFAPARFAVPIAIDDPVERMQTIHRLVAEQRAEPALPMTSGLATVLHRLPASVTTAVFGSMLKGVDFVTSNVPGVPVPVYLAGARLEAQFPFGPLSGSAANVTLLSYLDEVHVGVNTDRAAVRDPDVFLAALAEGFDEVLTA